MCSHICIKILVVKRPYELHLSFKLWARTPTRSCVKVPKGMGTENSLCFSWGFASINAVHYCSLLGHKTLVKALYKGNIPWSLGLFREVNLFIMLQRPIIWETCKISVIQFFFLWYKRILYVSGLKISDIV